MTSADGPRWWFDSGAAALDFTYADDDLAAWLTERFEYFDSVFGDRELRDATLFRQAVSRAARAASRALAADPADVDTINLFAATPDIPPALAGGTRQAGRTSVRAGQALSALAREAVGLLGGDTVERLRECAADDCHYVFYDESRSNNRRWCSMQRCGNRAKVRKHRTK